MDIFRWQARNSRRDRHYGDTSHHDSDSFSGEGHSINGQFAATLAGSPAAAAAANLQASIAALQAGQLSLGQVKLLFSSGITSLDRRCSLFLIGFVLDAFFIDCFYPVNLMI